MGAGASTNLDLTAEQKSIVARAVQEKYMDLNKDNNGVPTKTDSTFEADLLESLKLTYNDAVAKSQRIAKEGAKEAPSPDNSISIEPCVSSSPLDTSPKFTPTRALDNLTLSSKVASVPEGTELYNAETLLNGSVDAIEAVDQLTPLPPPRIETCASMDHHDDSSSHFALADSFQSRNGGDDTISVIEGPQRLLRAKTSVELMSLMQETQDHDDKIASFLSQLKAGEVLTKQQSEFRQRRLTYEKEHDSSNFNANSNTSNDNTNEDDSNISGNYSTKSNNNSLSVKLLSASSLPLLTNGPPSGGSPSRKSSSVSNNGSQPPRLGRSRTTIFASDEIGVIHKKKAPFPDTVMGTYSCHGIEPAPDEEDGVHEKINQDRGCVVFPYNNSKTEALFMVLDGHGEQGDRVSEFVMRQIVVSLEKDKLLNTEPILALKNAYITTNTALLVTDINYMTSGTTCVTVYLRDNRFYVANCGDSRAIMAYHDKETNSIRAKAFTRDHKPDDPEELERIQKWGGFVCPPHEEGLSARVYLDPQFTMIGLAMARSIGDHAVKNVGVIAEPEVKCFDLQPEDQFLLMASDGVWEFMTNDEAVEIVHNALDKGTFLACQELIETAASRWQEVEGDYRDDITAIVVRFPLPNFPAL